MMRLHFKPPWIVRDHAGSGTSEKPMSKSALVEAIRSYADHEHADWSCARFAIRRGENIVEFVLIERDQVTSLDRAAIDQVQPDASP